MGKHHRFTKDDDGFLWFVKHVKDLLDSSIFIHGKNSFID